LVTVRLDRGTGYLTQNTVTAKVEGTNSGCGSTRQFTVTFVGTRAGGTGLAAGGGTQSSVTLQSDPGDSAALGTSYHYTKADTAITLLSSGGYLSIFIIGKERWQGISSCRPASRESCPARTPPALSRYPFHDPAIGGLDWGDQSRGCGDLTGSMKVDSVTYANGSLATIHIRFEQTATVSRRCTARFTGT
jgi:hypothetical protein